ncbi:translocation/assembly module TamB domain-containing protein [Chitinimonas sp. PSY-7]|uniref:translocation/assembly module TamB domain-containing protein n=1 Tax=Chitinimonas sp. PSY-7 TaxID=3459088 RepID=UPI0040403653
MHDPADTPDTPPAPPEARKPVRRRFRFGLLWIELFLLGIIALVAVVILLAVSPQGTRLLFRIAEPLSGGMVHVDRVEGSLWQRLVLHNLQVKTAKLQLKLDRAELAWQPSFLLDSKVQIDQLALGRMQLHTQPSDEPSSIPDSLALPVALQLQQGTLESLVVNDQLILSDTVLTANSDGQNHRLQLLRTSTPWFAGDGELKLNGIKPFKLAGKVNLLGTMPDTPWQLNLQLGNNLEALQLRGNGEGRLNKVPAQQPFHADFDLLVAPFANSTWALVQRGTLHTEALNLQALLPSLPRTALDVTLQATPSGQAVYAKVAVRNTLAGNLPDGRLPLENLDAELLLDAQHAQIRQLQSKLAGGRLTLTGNASLEKLNLQASLEQINPSTLGGPALPVSGTLTLSGTPTNPQVVAALGDNNLGLDLDATLEGKGDARQLNAKQILIRHQNGQLELAGKVELAGQQRFDLQGKLANFDPASLTPLAGRPLPAGMLNAALSTHGKLAAAMQADVQLDFQPSQLNGQPLDGQLRAGWRGQYVEGILLAINLGKNRLNASGAFGRPADRLALDFSLPEVGDFGPGFNGKLDAKLVLAGTLQRPSLEGDAQATQLRLPGNFALDAATLHAKFEASPKSPANSPLSLKLDVTSLSGPSLTVPKLHLDVDGTQAAHSIRLAGEGTAAEQAFNLKLSATGALEANTWRGKLDQLENTGNWPLTLNSPTQVQLSAAGGEISGLDAQAVGAKINIRRAFWQTGRFAIQGQVQDVAVKEWLKRLPQLQTHLTTDLVLAANFDLSGDERLAGHMLIERQSGDLSLSVDDPFVKPMPLALSAAKFELNLNGDRAGIALDLKSAAFGSATGAFSSRFEKTEAGWRPARGAALEGQLSAEMPSLGWLGPLVGPTAKVDGRLSAELRAGGEIGAPRLFGRIAANDFALRMPDTGMNWHEGKLEATLEGDSVQLSTFSLKAGKGEATASGRMSLRNAGPEGTLAVVFNKFGVLSRPDRNLIVSGETNLGIQGEALTLTGKLTADSGLIELPKGGVQKLGDDVIVKGRTSPDKRQPKPTLLTMRLDLNLGEKFVFKGQGVDARVSGSVRLAASPTQPLNASGSLKVNEGRYAAYGQNLAITRGIITFQGPLDNPALDIEAIRKNLPHEVGVQITGTTLAPRATLISNSEEPMPDSEKLSWLVLGRGSGGTGNQGDADLLLTAADALFTAGESVSLRQQIATTFGLDDISIGRSETYTKSTDPSDPDSALTGRVISLGKRLSEKAYLSYEQGLDGVGSAVKLTYQLTRRVSVALSAGETSAVDVLYSWMFD